jgi:uncharacterized protein YbjT (DUF2867 family)
MTRYAVTGAFGFTGRHIAARLLADGHQVLTLTNHRAPVSPPTTATSTRLAPAVPSATPPAPGPAPALAVPVQPIAVAPLVFDRAALTRSLAGIDTLFNTYWVRFARGDTSHDLAVRNSLTLFEAARAAGVRRIVHISIANPDASSRLPYYSGKAQVEAALTASGMSYGILRPAVLFGDEPILFNNIAWLLRRLPVFGIAGDGRYRLQPIHVDDLAELAVRFAGQREDVVADAVGPETFEYAEVVGVLRRAVGSRALVIHEPARLTLLAAQMLGHMLGDVMLTRDELDGLMADLLVSHAEPLGWTSFTAWLAEASGWLGGEYLSELKRNFAAGRT